MSQPPTSSRGPGPPPKRVKYVHRTHGQDDTQIGSNQIITTSTSVESSAQTGSNENATASTSGQPEQATSPIAPTNKEASTAAVSDIYDQFLRNPLPEGFEVSAATTNYNNVLQAIKSGLSLRTEADHAAPSSANVELEQGLSEPTETSTHTVWNWEDAPVYESRSYKVTRVELKPAKVKPAGVAAKDVREVDFWSIWVKDQNSSTDPELEVYGAIPFAAKRIHQTSILRGGAVDTSICANQDEARQLGEYVCTLLDRFPYQMVSVEEWHEVSKRAAYCLSRRLVQSRALDLWLQPFDRTRINVAEAHRDLGVLTAAYNHQLYHGDQTKCIVILPTDEGDELTNQAFRTRISLDSINVEKLDRLPDLPAHFSYGSTEGALTWAIPEGATPLQRQALLKAFRRTLYAVAFKVGTKDSIEALAHAELQRFANGPMKSRKKRHRGAPDAQANSVNSVQVLLDHVGRDYLPPCFDIVYESHLTKLKPLNCFNNAVRNGQIPTLVVKDVPKDFLAYIVNQVMSEVINGERQLLEGILKGAIAADQITLKQVSLEEVTERYCVCATNDNKASTYHACMECIRPCRCSILVRTHDSRWICPTCVKLNLDAQNQRNLDAQNQESDRIRRKTTVRKPRKPDIGKKTNLESKVHTTILRIRRAEIDAGGIDLDYGQMMAKLQSDSPFLKNGVWRDTNDGNRLFEDGLWPEDSTPRQKDGSRLPHPLALSVDAKLPFVMIEGRSAYHHQSNIGLTTFGINLAKSVWPPCILAVFRTAAINTELEGVTDPAQRNLACHRDINNAMDRVHHITQSTPHALRKRLEITSDDINESSMVKFIESCRSSVWDPEEPLPLLRGKMKRQYQYLTGADLVFPKSVREGALIAGITRPKLDVASSSRTPVWPPWTQAQKDQLMKVVDEIEQDGAANPHKLTIPRGGCGAPWPFRADHMFHDDDLWNWWYYEALNRYHVMFRDCNWEHDTNESPMTILLEIVVQWFRSGGVYDWIHCEMTVFARHPQRYSLGRNSNVEPGSPMRTGFLVSNPTSFRGDYNVERCTIVVQPGFVNLLWWAFPLSSHDMLMKLLLELPAENDDYTRFQRNTAAVEYPKFSGVHLREFGTALEPLSSDDDEADNLDDPLPFLLGDDSGDESDDNSDDDHSDDDEDEDADEVLKILRAEFTTLRNHIEQIYPTWHGDLEIRRFFRALRRASEEGEEQKYYELAEELHDHIFGGEDPEKCCVCHKPFEDDTAVECSNSAHDDAYFHPACGEGDFEMQTDGDPKGLCPACKNKQEATPNCCVCGEHALEGSMLTCSNPAHSDAVFHFWCAELQSVHHSDPMMLCPICKHQSGVSGTSRSGHWNMCNLGETCYASSSVQILCHLGPISTLLSSHAEIIGKPTEMSGRFAKEWLPSSYEFTSTTSDSTLTQWLDRHMQDVQRLYKRLSAVARYLSNAEGPMENRHSRELFECIQKINPKEWKNSTNDSADLFANLLECIVLITDDSTTQGRGGIARLTERRDQQLKNGELANLTEASLREIDAYQAEGRTSAIFSDFCILSVQEWRCPDASCHGIGRGFTRQPITTLDLPSTTAGPDAFTLHRILQQWSCETTDSNCAFGKHSRGKVTVYRKITISPKFLMLRFGRTMGDSIREEHVDLPDYLDTSPYGDSLELPSDSDSGKDPTNFNQQCIYRLVAVNMYIPSNRHFVAYILVNGEWLLFDDLKSRETATPRHPQAAVNEGSVVYYVVYEQQKDKRSLPLGANNEETVGHTLSRNAEVPATKVLDLYNLPPAPDDPNPGHQVGADADEATNNMAEREQKIQQREIQLEEREKQLQEREQRVKDREQEVRNDRLQQVATRLREIAAEIESTSCP